MNESAATIVSLVGGGTVVIEGARGWVAEQIDRAQTQSAWFRPVWSSDLTHPDVIALRTADVLTLQDAA